MSKLTVMIAALAATTACTSPHDRGGARGDEPHDTWADTEAPSQGGLFRQAIEHARRAAAHFDAMRATRTDRLYARITLAQLEDTMLHGMSELVDLSAPGRTDVDAKLEVMTNRLDQASFALDQLDEANDRDFAAAEQSARESLAAVETARAAVWRAIGDARRGSESAGSAAAGSADEKPST